jgi:hypothetical protein
LGGLGELYAEIKYWIERYRLGMAGLVHRLDNDWVEIKTIPPGKGKGKVLVKRAGNFKKLLIVKVNERFKFEFRMGGLQLQVQHLVCSGQLISDSIVSFSSAITGGMPSLKV